MPVLFPVMRVLHQNHRAVARHDPVKFPVRPALVHDRHLKVLGAVVREIFDRVVDDLIDGEHESGRG